MFDKRVLIIFFRKAVDRKSKLGVRYVTEAEAGGH